MSSKVGTSLGMQLLGVMVPASHRQLGAGSAGALVAP